MDGLIYTCLEEKVLKFCRNIYLTAENSKYGCINYLGRRFSAGTGFHHNQIMQVDSQSLTMDCLKIKFH